MKKCKIERHKILTGYIVDGYVKDKNIVFEVDENYHFSKKYIKKDKEREDNLINSIGCTIIRIRDCKDSSRGGVYAVRT
jgi:very-short-patch-repair endonuclease